MPCVANILASCPPALASPTFPSSPTVPGHGPWKHHQKKPQMVESKTKAAEDAEKNFKDEVSKLQKKYEELQSEKEAAVEASNVDMRVMRQVVGAADSA